MSPREPAATRHPQMVSEPKKSSHPALDSVPKEVSYPTWPTRAVSGKSSNNETRAKGVKTS
jgi:hypothetical protein